MPTGFFRYGVESTKKSCLYKCCSDMCWLGVFSEGVLSNLKFLTLLSLRITLCYTSLQKASFFWLRHMRFSYNYSCIRIG
jgi:hypothetical protein